MSALLELAERCERATGADRELDFEMHCAINGWPMERTDNEFYARIDGERYMVGWLGNEVKSSYYKVRTDSGAPRYTASIDAAMTLAPSELELAIYTNWPLVQQYEPRNDDGSWTVRDSTLRGCWVRPYGGSESGGIKNIGPRAHSVALALCAFALRARAAEGEST